MNGRIFRITSTSVILILAVYLCFNSLLVQYVSGSVGNEPCISKAETDSPNLVIDDLGIPIVDYGCINGKYIGPQRNPVTISDQALQQYEYYEISRSYDTLQIFLNNANWLASNTISHGNYSIFEYKFPSLTYSTQQPWQSAMANGKALEVLFKANNITGDKKYLDVAEQLLNAFFIEVKDGGITYKTPHDGWWYELVATGSTQHEPRVLNGMMFALLGIYDYYNHTKSDKAKFLFDQGIVALKKNLPKYDYKGEYSYYDAYPRQLSPLSYHKVVVQQLADIYKITKDAIIKKYHDEWQNFNVPVNILDSILYHRTVNKPSLIFKLTGSDNAAVRTYGTYNSNTGLVPYSYGLRNKLYENFTSQYIAYRVNNISLYVSNLDSSPDASIVFAFDFEGIHRDHYFINAVLESPKNSKGWDKEGQYFFNIEPKTNVVIDPVKIIGHDYLRLGRVSINISNQSLVHTVDFKINLH